MDHIVRFTTSSGEDKIEDVGSLDDAIARVESLRNDEGVDNPRLYREVKVEFKTYVRASVVDENAPAPVQTTPSRGTPSPPPAATTSPEPPTATASEPPPGAMPLNPRRPTTKVNEVIEAEDEDDTSEDEDEDGGGPRRTLFSRS